MASGLFAGCGRGAIQRLRHKTSNVRAVFIPQIKEFENSLRVLLLQKKRIMKLTRRTFPLIDSLEVTDFMNQTQPSGPSHTKAISAVMIIGTFIAILNQTLLATALPHIMRSLQISADEAQWLTSVYMLINAIVIPNTAFLMKRFSMRRLFIYAMGFFSAGTLLAGLSPNFAVLLFARILQAVGGGIMVPFMQTVFLVLYPREKRGSVMGIVGLVISFAPAIGPTLSGWIIDRLPWNALFLLVLPVAVIVLVIGAFVIDEKSETEKSKIDIPSVLFSSLGFGGIMYGINSLGASELLSAPEILSFLVGAVCLFLFIRRQLRLSCPMLEFRVFQNRTFNLTTIISMVSFGMMVGVEVLIPLYIQNTRGMSALTSGLILLPGAFLTALLSPVSGSLYDRFGARPLLIVGDAVMALMSVGFIFVGADTSIIWIAVLYALRMIGISIITTPAMTAGVNALSDNLIAHATAVYNTFRQIGGSLGTVLLVAVMTAGTSQSLKTMAPKAAQIKGLQIAFFAATVFSFVGLLFSFGVKGRNKDRLANT